RVLEDQSRQNARVLARDRGIGDRCAAEHQRARLDLEQRSDRRSIGAEHDAQAALHPRFEKRRSTRRLCGFGERIGHRCMLDQSKPEKKSSISSWLPTEGRSAPAMSTPKMIAEPCTKLKERKSAGSSVSKR